MHRRDLLNQDGKSSGRWALTLGIVIALTLVGAGLRFHGYRDLCPFVADEADYHMEARYIYHLITAIKGSAELRVEEMRSGEDVWKLEDQGPWIAGELKKGKVPWYARPGHVYFIVFLMFLFGPDKAYLGSLVSAFFGTLTIPLVFLLGRALAGRWAGVVAALLVALSGYHVLYSRSALTEADSTFFILAAALAYYRSRWAGKGPGILWILVTGLLLGMSFLCHYRMLLMFILFAGLEVHLWFTERERDRGEKASRIFLMTGAFGVVLLLCDLPYYVAMIVLHVKFHAMLPFMTYFEQLIVQFLYISGTNIGATMEVFSPANLLSYAYLLPKIEGPVYALAVLGGIYVTLRERRPGWLMLAALFLFPLVFYSFAHPNARYAVLVIPFGAIMIGRLVMVLSRRGSLGAALLVAALTASGLYFSVADLGMRTDAYTHVFRFMEHKGTTKHVASYPALTRVFVGNENVPERWPASYDELFDLYREGFRFCVVDFTRILAEQLVERFGEAMPEAKRADARRQLAVFDLVEEELEPVFTYENPPVRYLHNIFEVNHNFLMVLRYRKTLAEESNDAGTIRVYDLRELFEPEQVPARDGGQEGVGVDALEGR